VPSSRIRGAIQLPHYTFMAWCSVKRKKHRDNCTFTFNVAPKCM